MTGFWKCHCGWNLLFNIPVLLAVPALGAEPEVPHPEISKGVVAAERLEKGLLFADGFDGSSINEDDWRIWISEPGQVELSVHDGRFVAKGRGMLSHNGLWLKHNFQRKDVVLIARMDIRSRGANPHNCVLHLCGGDMPHSPDHWVELVMRDAGNQALFRLGSALPKGFSAASEEPLAVSRPEEGGFLAKVELNGSTNFCTASVKDAGQWKRVGEPLKLQVRTTHCEIKLHRQDHAEPAGEETTSEAWFDDVRMYPRPESHPVLLRLVTRKGDEPWYQPTGAWPPVVDIRGKSRSIEDLVVELRTADGGACVDRVQSANFGYYMLSLDKAPWDVYPVAARIRLLLDGEQLGEDAIIPLDGLDGLYPDDVWSIVLE